MMPTGKELDQIADDSAYFLREFPKMIGKLLALSFYLVARTWRRSRRAD